MDATMTEAPRRSAPAAEGRPRTAVNEIRDTVPELATPVWAKRLALGVGWFSIGLGLAEVLAPGRITRLFNVDRGANLVRGLGVREIASGVGILMGSRIAPVLWGRVAGDALDLATLGAATPGNSRKANLAIAYGAVAGATLLDTGTARALGKVVKKPGPVRDYGDRSGFPMGVAAARGLARKDFAAPGDMQAPQQPRAVH